MGLFNYALFNQGLFNSPGTADFSGVSVVNLTQVNSTSYIDMVGVFLGLDRITGETSDVFAKRLMEAARSKRDGTYAGLLNELRLQLGLEFQRAINVSSTGSFSLTCSIAGVKLTNSATTYCCPLLTIDPDGLWIWKQLSDIVAFINGIPEFAASLVGTDGPALQLTRQSNTFVALSEAISGANVTLANQGLIQGSELFSFNVPSYTYSADGGTLYFVQPVPDGVTVTYQYQRTPFTLISCPAAMVALTDPDLASVAITSDNQLTYQAREFIWAISNADLTYWAK